MNKEKFYITTPIYYVNGRPHIGHAYTTIAADVLARFQKEQNKEVFLLTGTDEHGLKIQKKAEEAGEDPQKFVDSIAEQFKKLWKDLDIEYDNFVRTTGEKHKKAVQKVLDFLHKKGAIYKGEYEGLYCVGCEQFKNESDLVDGKCPDHNVEPERMKEECYLLKMADKQEELVEKIKKDEFKIRPLRYKNEILSFLENQPLKDLSISRKNIDWGIPLPFDQDHTAYVWVDALLNYLTGLGWDGDPENLPEKWPANVQIIGKDILRVHATIWPILLLHLGVPLSKELFVHGHILSGGKKMSKTLGNVIGIEEMIEKFGVDGTRYLLLSAGTFGEDIDITMERMVKKYNADLANGLGNLVSRVVKLSEDLEFDKNFNIKVQGYEDYMNSIRLDLVLKFAWLNIKEINQYIDEVKPWELKNNNKDKFKKIMSELVGKLAIISAEITSFMPETSKKIENILATKKSEILFPKIK